MHYPVIPEQREKNAMKRRFACLAATVLLYGITSTTALDEPLQKTAKEELEVQKIKVKTELMEVRVVVSDRKGQIIENLKKEDFELLENDKPQEISFFSISQLDSEKSQPTAVDKEVQGKAAWVQGVRERLSEAPLRTTLIYVDNLHLSFSGLNWVKQALRRFINERLTDQDLVALATSSNTLGIAQQFTRDRRLLRYGIEQMRVGPARPESGLFPPSLAAGVLNERPDAFRMAIDVVRRENNIQCPCNHLLELARAKALQVLSEASYSRKATLSVVKEFAEHMIRLPGKRMIVAFSDGFTMRENDGAIHNEELQSTINRAVRSGVVIYSIDAKGLQAPPSIDVSRNVGTKDAVYSQCEYCQSYCPRDCKDCSNCETDFCVPEYCIPPDSGMGSGLWTSFVYSSEREELDGLHALAEETGGKMYTETNDLNAALSQAFDANRFYYVLAYHLTPGGGERRIKVRVKNHPDYTVRAPKGFVPLDATLKPEEEAAKTPQQRLLHAIGAPMPKTDLNVSAQADFMETETDSSQVTLTVFFEGDRFQYRQQDQRNAFEVEILYVIYDSSGKLVGKGTSARVEGKLSQQRLNQAKTTGYRFTQRLTLTAGVYQVRVGVREEGADLMGTAATWIEVPKLDADKLEMSSVILRNPLDSPRADKEGIDVGELEQVKIVQGIPLFTRGDVCAHSFRVRGGTQASEDFDLLLMREVLRDGKPILQEKWLPISSKGRNIDSKGWFDLRGEIDLGGCDPDIYELRVSIKDPRSNKIVQRTAVFGVE